MKGVGTGNADKHSVLVKEISMLAIAPVLAQVEVTSGSLLLWGIVSVLAGIAILIVPRILNYVVAAYLIIIGVLQIIAAL